MAQEAVAESAPPALAPPEPTAATVSAPAAAPTAEPNGPSVVLPPEPVVPASDEAAANSTDSHTGVGGYAELHLNMARVTGPGSPESTVDMHRFVLFVSHEWSEQLRFYSELEIEHAVSETGAPGAAEVEQAYIEYALSGDALALRAGLVLVPMGIINQWHEPPMFHGVERPSVDELIIPSTWREAALGIVGEPIAGLRYELYLMSGLSAAGINPNEGLHEGMGEAAEAVTNGIAIAGRVQYEPVLGVVAGLSGYYGHAGANAELYDAAGKDLDLTVPVVGLALDARGQHAGLEARAELAYFHVGDTAQLRTAFDDSGKSLGLDMGAVMYGVYGEVAYDVLHVLDVEPQLLPFVRVERFDTLASVSGRRRTSADDVYAVTELEAGLTLRLIKQVAFKIDFRLKNPDGPTQASGETNLGLGVMF